MRNLKQTLWRAMLLILLSLVVLWLLAPPYVIKGDGAKVVIWLHGYNQDASMAPDLDAVVIAPVYRKKADWENYNLRPIIWIAKRYNLPIEIEGFSRGAYGAAYHAAENPGVFQEVRCLAGYYPDFPQIVDPVKIYAGVSDFEWRHSSSQYAKNLGKEVNWITSDHHMGHFYEGMPR